MSSCRDHQKSKAYSWEDQIHNKDTTIVPFDELQPLVDYVWKEAGFEYPPKIRKMPEQRTGAIADATRFDIRVHEDKGLKTTVLLHEIAHSMTRGESHGPRWVGCFMILLERHCRMNLLDLMISAKRSGVKFDLSGPNI